MRLFYALLSFFPTKLPVGKTAFDAWVKSIVDLVGPIADESSLRWVIGHEVMRLGSSQDRVAKRRFVKTLRRYAAGDIAMYMVRELKTAQEERIKAEKLAETNLKAEAIAVPTAPDGTPA